MPTPGRPQQRYDHRLWNLVQHTGDVTVATDRGVRGATWREFIRAQHRQSLLAVDFFTPETV